VLAVGGNGRVQTASDTWLLSGAPDALFQCPVALYNESGAHDFYPVKRQWLV